MCRPTAPGSPLLRERCRSSSTRRSSAFAELDRRPERDREARRHGRSTRTTDSGRRWSFLCASCRRAPTPCAGTHHVQRGPRRLGRLHVRRSRQAAAADRGVRRAGADASPSTSSKLGLLRGAGAARRRARRSGCSSLRGRTVTPALERRFYWIVTGVGVVGVHRAPASSRSSSGLPTRSSLPLDQLLYGDLSPLATRHALRHRVHRDDARLRGRRGVPLTWPGSLDRTILLWPAFFLGLVFAAPGSRCRGTRPWTSGRRGSPELADYVHLVRRVLLGRRPRHARIRRSGRRRRACGDEAFHRFSQLAAVLVRRWCSRARTSRTSGCPRSRTSGRPATGRCC